MIDIKLNNNDIDTDSFDSTLKSESRKDKKSNSAFGNALDAIFKGDKVIWIVFIILSCISIIEIFSATSTLAYKADSHWAPIFRHSIFLILGFGVILIMFHIPYKIYRKYAIWGLLLSIVLLLITAKFGETINGAERGLTFFGVTIQPLEFAKIALISTIAFLLSKQNKDSEDILFKWMIGLMFVVTLIIAVQNLSTAILLFGVCFLMMFIGNVKLIKLFKLVVVCVASVTLLILLLSAITIPEKLTDKGPLKRLATWQNRIKEFCITKSEKSEEKTYVVTEDNYQVAYSKIAIANGKVFGRFPGKSITRDFLPQAYSDFIYAIIIEELGFLGGIFVLMMYVVLLIRAGFIARKIDQLFPKYIVIGSALMLSTQALVNMAVAVNLIPVTGQPLPLVSRGGTSTLITCAYFGLILSADYFSKERKKKKDILKENIDTNNINDDIEYKVFQI